MYGMPQASNYGQYGFGAYPGFPAQAGATAAAPTSPAIPQSASAAGTGLGLTAGGQQGPSDPTAAANQAAQASWASADPSTYYSNYWGGAIPILPFKLFFILISFPFRLL